MECELSHTPPRLSKGRFNLLDNLQKISPGMQPETTQKNFEHRSTCTLRTEAIQNGVPRRNSLQAYVPGR